MRTNGVEMEINTQFLDWFSIAHLVFGLALGYFYKKNLKWVLAWIVGWELLEYFVLPHVCCANFWLEKPTNVLGDIIVGLLGYAVGARYWGNFEKVKKALLAALKKNVWLNEGCQPVQFLVIYTVPILVLDSSTISGLQFS